MWALYDDNGIINYHKKQLIVCLIRWYSNTDKILHIWNGLIHGLYHNILYYIKRNGLGNILHEIKQTSKECSNIWANQPYDGTDPC